MLRVIFSVGVRIPGGGMGNHAYDAIKYVSFLRYF